MRLRGMRLDLSASLGAPNKKKNGNPKRRGKKRHKREGVRGRNDPRRSATRSCTYFSFCSLELHDVLQENRTHRHPCLLVRGDGQIGHALEPLKLLSRIVLALRLHLLNVLLLLVVAVVESRNVALRGEVFLHEALEALDVPATVVGLTVRFFRSVVLDRRVPLHAVFTAEVVVDRAVNVGDDNLRAGSVHVRELVPGGLHRLAVASPGREELDEGVLPRVLHVLGEGARIELEGAEGPDGKEKAEHQCAEKT